jgi:MarR family
LTNHAQVRIRIAHDSGTRLREIGERVEITERVAHRIVAELVAAGYISRQRDDRRSGNATREPERARSAGADRVQRRAAEYRNGWRSAMMAA